MSTLPSESARLRVPVDIHQHDAPPGVACEPAPGRADGSETSAGHGAGRLWREGGKVLYSDSGGGEAVAVRLVWARPLSDRGGPVSVLQAGKKREIAYLENLSVLDGASRRIAEEELERGMVMPAVTAIYSVRQRFGNYYWDVETDRGRKKFLLTSPETNSLRPTPDSVVVRDVSGNCYAVPSVESLDRTSRIELERVL